MDPREEDVEETEEKVYGEPRGRELNVQRIDWKGQKKPKKGKRGLGNVKRWAEIAFQETKSTNPVGPKASRRIRKVLFSMTED